MTDARDKHFSLVPIILIDRENLGNELHPVRADIVKSSHEWTHDVSASLRSEQRLVRRKAESHVCPNVFCLQAFYRFKPLAGKWNLHDNLIIDFRQLTPFT